MEKVIRKIKPNIPILPVLVRVAAYTRVSSGKDAMLHSLSAQVSYYNDLIQRNPEWQFAGVYSDEAVTGTKENRKGFQSLLADCRDGKIDMIITKSISRFARNTVTLLETVRELKTLNIDVFFEEQNIHTNSGEGELMLTILASFAQEESRSVSENCKWRIRNRFAAGDPPKVRAYGYHIIRKQWVVNEAQAKIVRFIFAKHNQRVGTWTIADMLNQMGVKPPFAEKWCGDSIRYLLKNERYTGDLVLQKSYVASYITKRQVLNRGELDSYFVENACPAIISRETFDLAQQISLEQTYEAKQSEDFTQRFFRGKLICPHCGKSYKRKKAHDKIAWNCSTFLRKGRQYCYGKQIPEEILWDVCLEVVDDGKLEKIDHIVVPEPNKLKFVFQNGEEKECMWADKSRSESWSQEMRAKAAEDGKRRWSNE